MFSPIYHLERAKHGHRSTKEPKKVCLFTLLRILCILYLTFHPFFSKETLKGVKTKIDPSYWNNYHSVEQLASKLEVWEHKDLKEFPICRLERVCRTERGLWILPKRLHEHHSWLQKCGLNQSSLWYADIRDSIPIHNSTFDGDLIGTDILRWQLPHFIADTIWILLWRHFIFHPENTSVKPWSFKCINSASKPCITTLFWSALEPVLFHNAIPLEDDWTSQYLRQILFRTVPVQWKTVSPYSPTCFRSVTFSRIRPAHIPKNTLSGENMFFEENGIVREDRLKSSFQKARNTGRCMITVALKNNTIENHTNSSAESFFELVAQRIRQLAFDSIDDSYQSKIEIRFIDFLSSNLDDWDNAKERLQGVDVVVTDHSIANSQFLVLRPNTTVIEVLPFAYSAVMFKELASSLGLDYHSVFSNPDEETFLGCLFRYEQEPLSVAQLVQAYRQEAENWRYGNPYQQTLHLDKIETTDKVRMCRHCARQQRISANATEIALFAIQRALTPCLAGLWYHQREAT